MPIKYNRVIYRLWHNKSIKGKVGYIGKDTKFPCRIQLESRRKDGKCVKLYAALKKYPVSVWHVEILARGFRTHKSLAKAEKIFIAKFKAVQNGYNVTKGGGGFVAHHSEATKKKISRSLSGNIISKETRLKISKALVGRKHSKQTRLKLRMAHLGKKLSAEHRRKLRDAHIGKKSSYSCRRAISLALMGNTNAKKVK